MRSVHGLSVSLAALSLLALTACTGVGSGGSTTVSVTRTGPVAWLATQDGSGAWQTLIGTSFTVADSAGRFGVAWACRASGAQAEVWTLQATTSESTSITTACDNASPPATTSYTISGTLTGIPTGGSGYISIAGLPFARVTTSPSGTFSLTVPAGVHTLVAYALNASGGVDTTTGMVLDRNVSISASNANFNVDLTQVGQQYNLGVVVLQNVPTNETPQVQVDLVTADGEDFAFPYANSSQASFPMVPILLKNTGDTYSLTGSGFDLGISGTTLVGDQKIELITRSLGQGSTTSLSVPGALSSNAQFQVSGGTEQVDWGSLWLKGMTGLGVYSVRAAPSSSSYPVWRALVTKGWLGTKTTYALPDFTSTSGWDPSLDFPTGQSGKLRMRAFQASISLTDFLASNGTVDAGTAADGTTSLWADAYASGTF